MLFKARDPVTIEHRVYRSWFLFIYLFKISDRRTRGPLILSEKHRNT